MRLGKCTRCGGTAVSDGSGRHVDVFICDKCNKKIYIPKDCDQPTSWFGYIMAETFGFADNIVTGGKNI